jgi:hypothetical protein
MFSKLSVLAIARLDGWILAEISFAALHILWLASVALEMMEVSVLAAQKIEAAFDGDSRPRRLDWAWDRWLLVSILAPLHWFSSVALERIDAYAKTISTGASDALP